MNLPVHVISAGAGVAIGYSRMDTWELAGFFCLAAFLDLDHYLYYVLRFRSFRLGRAIAYFERNKHTVRFCICVFHTVEFFVIFGLAAYLSRSGLLRACFAGVALHFALDIAQGLYYKRLHYRWWSLTNYLRRSGHAENAGGCS